MENFEPDNDKQQGVLKFKAAYCIDFVFNHKSLYRLVSAVIMSKNQSGFF